MERKDENQRPKDSQDVDFYQDGVVPANTEETRKKTADFLRAKRAEERKNPKEDEPPEDKNTSQR